MADKEMIIGIDIGGTAVKMGLFTISGELNLEWSIPTDLRNAGENIISQIASSIKEKLNDNNLTLNQLKGIGVGVPGPVNSEGIVPLCVNLGWTDKKVAKEFEELCCTNVIIANDANAAGLGEIWKGCASGYENVVFITLGTGVGGSIICGQKIAIGKNGISGEIGHLIVNPFEKEMCNCGRYGCLEQYASATGLIKRVETLLSCENNNSILTNLSNITAKDIIDAAKLNDIVANIAVEEVTDKLGFALANISCVIDPEMFIIGGGMSEAGGFLIDKIAKYYQKYAFSASKSTPICKSILGNKAGIYGAAMLIKQSLVKKYI
ncbi:MAG: ROK family glucokinase [Oscillospiraceae bacterium]